MASLVNARNLPRHGLADVVRLAQLVPGYRLRYSDADDVAIDDPGQPQRRIEPVARVGEVRLGGGRPESGVDAHEQEPKTGPDQIGDGRVLEAAELGLGETHRTT